MQLKSMGHFLVTLFGAQSSHCYVIIAITSFNVVFG